MERILLKKLDFSTGNLEGPLFELARFYHLSGRIDSAIPYSQRLLSQTHAPQAKAGYAFHLGQLVELLQRFEDAIDYYIQVLALEPVHRDLCYFLQKTTWDIRPTS